MTDKNIKPKIDKITKPIIKKLSPFVNAKANVPKKMSPNKDAYNKRQ